MSPRIIRFFVLWNVLLLSSITGTVTGLLSWLGGLNVPNSILSGAGAIVASAAFLLALAEFFLRGLEDN